MVNEDDFPVMINNTKYRYKQFKSMEEALAFIEKNCSHLWTHLFTYVDGEWISSGSTWSKESC